MIAAMVLLLLQEPSLSEASAEALSGEVPRTLAMSAGGTWLVLGMEDRLEIRDSKTLKQVRTIPLRWTEFGFDERDGELLVIGEEATRFRTKDWSIRFQQPLNDAAFAIAKSICPVPTDDGKTKRPPFLTGQALVLPDLDFYCRTKGGGMSMGTWNEGKLTSTPGGAEKGDTASCRRYRIVFDGPFKSRACLFLSLGTGNQQTDDGLSP